MHFHVLGTHHAVAQRHVAREKPVHQPGCVHRVTEQGPQRAPETGLCENANPSRARLQTMELFTEGTYATAQRSRINKTGLRLTTAVSTFNKSKKTDKTKKRESGTTAKKENESFKPSNVPAEQFERASFFSFPPRGCEGVQSMRARPFREVRESAQAQHTPVGKMSAPSANFFFPVDPGDRFTFRLRTYNYKIKSSQRAPQRHYRLRSLELTTS